MFKWIWIQN